MNFNEMVAKLDGSVKRFLNLRGNSDVYGKSLHEQIELTQKLYDFINGEGGSPDTEILEKIFWEAEADRKEAGSVPGIL